MEEGSQEPLPFTCDMRGGGAVCIVAMNAISKYPASRFGGEVLLGRTLIALEGDRLRRLTVVQISNWFPIVDVRWSGGQVQRLTLRYLAAVVIGQALQTEYGYFGCKIGQCTRIQRPKVMPARIVLPE